MAAQARRRQSKAAAVVQATDAPSSLSPRAAAVLYQSKNKHQGGEGGRVYLGIDIGTSGVKTVLIEAGQRVIASASAPLDVLRPRSGWSEQDPDAWWAATQATLDELKTRYGREMAAVE